MLFPLSHALFGCRLPGHVSPAERAFKAASNMAALPPKLTVILRAAPRTASMQYSVRSVVRREPGPLIETAPAIRPSVVEHGAGHADHAGLFFPGAHRIKLLPWSH